MPDLETVVKTLMTVAVLTCGPHAVAGEGPSNRAAATERVREAALATYIHGMTDEIATREIGVEGIPVLVELLADPDFERRDNVVAFLAHLDRGRATAALERLLESPPGPVGRASEDRALLLAPQALGRIAARGDARALSYLMEITAPGGHGGPLHRPLAAGAIGERLRDDLVEAALHGLALTRNAEAESRLVAISAATAAPILPNRDLRPAARHELGVSRDAETDSPRALDGTGSDPVAPARSDVAPVIDDRERSHDSALTWATHALLPSEAPDAGVDRELLLASRLVATENFPEDVACCVRFTRSGNRKHFGSAGDGLDIVDSPADLVAVFDDPVARVKVVREIRWCGGPGTNIIGCAERPGRSIAAVKVSRYGVLWVHEFGHNAGLGHATDSRYIMSPTMTTQENAIHEFECRAFHEPPPAAAAILTDIGACHDDDGDQIVSSVDNCPDTPNLYQGDNDLDLVGQDCDNCPLNPNHDQLDEDDDDVGDVCDNCLETSNPDQVNADDDDLGDACDICFDSPNDYDADGLCSDVDNCHLEPNNDQSDTDGDGLGDLCDPCEGDVVNDPDGDGRCAAEDSCPLSSNVVSPWSIHVAIRRALIPLPSVALGDVNGDGLTDVLMGNTRFDVDPNAAQDDGAVFVYLSSASGYPSRPSQALYGIGAHDDFGFSVASGGDVNGDGFDDAVVGSDSRRADVYYGSDSGLIPVATTLEVTDDRFDQYGRKVAILRDVNGDGFDDVAVGVLHHNTVSFHMPGAVRVHHGGAGGVETAPSLTLPGEGSQGFFGMRISSGDFDDDGFGDAVVAAPHFRVRESHDLSTAGRVYVYRGSPTGLAPAPSWVGSGTKHFARFGDALATADLNGDGIEDLVVGAPGYDLDPELGRADGAVYAYAGTPGGPATDPLTVRYGSDGDEGLGMTVSGLGDLDGDGHDELVVGARQGSGDGAAYVYGGSPAGLESQPRWRVSGPEGGGTSQIGLGTQFVGRGDANGDGVEDLFTDGSVVRNSRTHWVISVFLGVPGGFAGAQPDRDDDGVGDACDIDTDGDGLSDDTDNCPLVVNDTQADANSDGVGDDCDADADGIRDDADNCPSVANPDQRFHSWHTGQACDTDLDGTRDHEDNCVSTANYLQTDTDGDGLGNPCDDDDDGDGVSDAEDNCDLLSNQAQADADGDGLGDPCDEDIDGDARLNILDNCPGTPNPDQQDRDEDSLGDACDLCTDVDGDGVGSPAGAMCPVATEVDCDDTDAGVFPGAPDLCDERDNDCSGVADDATCDRFDFTVDGHVDGLELAWLGRSFGLCSPAPDLEWWGPVDYSRDSCIDGDDLAILASVFGCGDNARVCDAD